MKFLSAGSDDLVRAGMLRHDGCGDDKCPQHRHGSCQAYECPMCHTPRTSHLGMRCGLTHRRSLRTGESQTTEREGRASGPGAGCRHVQRLVTRLVRTSRVTWQSRRPCPLNKAPRRQQRYPHQQTNEPTHGRRHSFRQALRRGHDVGYEARRQERICEGDNRRTEPPSRNAATPIATGFVIQRQLRHVLLSMTACFARYVDLSSRPRWTASLDWRSPSITAATGRDPEKPAPVARPLPGV